MLSSGSFGTISTVSAGDSSRPIVVSTRGRIPVRGPPAILPHGDLPDAALPAEKMVAERVGG